MIYYKFDEQHGQIRAFDQVNANHGLFRGLPLREDSGAFVYPHYTLDGNVVDIYTLELTGYDRADPQSHEWEYWINSLPKHGILYDVKADGSIGAQITNVPFKLNNYRVGYRWEWYVRNIEDPFSYIISGSLEESKAVVWVVSTPTCDGHPEHLIEETCGVCGGDGSECQCIHPGTYKGFELSELNEMMIWFSAQYTNQLLQKLHSKIDLTLSKLNTPDWRSKAAATELADVLKLLRSFEEDCMDPWKSTVSEFMNSAVY
jgi:hypothetical protein